MMAAAKTKEQWRAEISATEKQIDDLTKRRDELSTEVEKIADGIESLSSSIGDEILAGKDPVKILESMQREKNRGDAIRKAINQADAKIKELRTKLEGYHHELMMVDYTRIEAESKTLVLEMINRALDLNASYDALYSKRVELAKVSNTDFRTDETKSIFKIHGNFSQENILEHKIKRLESTYPEIFSQARALREK